MNMKTISIPGAIYSRPAETYDFDEKQVNGRTIRFFAAEVRAFGEWQVVAPFKLTFELPENWDPAPAEVARLQAQKAEVIAKFQAMITEIDRQINERLAIENGVSA